MNMMIVITNRHKNILMIGKFLQLFHGLRINLSVTSIYLSVLFFGIKNSFANLIASSSPMTGSTDKEASSLLFTHTTANFSAVITLLNEVGPESRSLASCRESHMFG